MISIELLKESIRVVLGELKSQKYSKYTIRIHKYFYKDILSYMQSKSIFAFSEKVCLEYLAFKTGHKIEGFYGTGNRKINAAAKPLQVLLDYIQTGAVRFSMRPKIPPFLCPSQFEEEYQAFKEELIYRNYSRSTVISNTEKVNKFLTFLDSSGVDSSRSINARHLTDFLYCYRDRRPKYISTIIYVLRNYLTFLYGQGYIDKDMSQSLPKVAIRRNATLPYYWKKDDIGRLLNAVDRGDPKGKDAMIIGRVVDGKKRVILETSVGGRRIMDPPYGDPVPRIC